jgi:hypothetical protein
MAGGFPMLGGWSNGVNYGASSSNSQLGLFRASGTANTKGAWALLQGATTFDAVMALVQLSPGGTNTLSIVSVDIGIGTNGSEVVLIPDLLLCRHDARAQLNAASYLIPINIPAGTRISARCQSNVTTDQSSASGNTVGVQLILFDGDFTQSSGGGGVDAIGFSSSSTIGTAVTPNASANVKGSYAQLVASSSADYAGFLMAIDDGGSTSDHPVNMLWDIAIGPGGQETIIVPNFYMLNGGFGGSPPGGQSPVTTPFFPIRIPSGTRIAARFQCDGASQPALDLTLYGIRQ